jgi:imidazolonepropionase-like amidohydrolase
VVQGITGAALFDGHRFHEEAHFVGIHDGLIERVEASKSTGGSSGPRGDIIDFSDVSGATILPGLIDAHVHLAISGADQSEKQDPAPLVALRMVHNGLVNLRAGITTVRDLGTKDHIDVSYKRGLGLKLIQGPRYLSAGQPIIATGGHTPYMGKQVDGPYEARRATREQLQAGADWIKMMVTGGIMTRGTDPTRQQLFRDEIQAVVETAHAAGIPVAAHCQGGPGIADAITAGIDSLEHGIWLTDEAVDLLLEHRTAYIPTLSAISLIAEGVPVAGVNPPAWAVEKALVARDAHRESFVKAVAAGVRIVAGTDYRHGSLPYELALMVDYGMPPLEALRSATSRAAELLRLPLVGRIAPRMVADLVVVAGNPMKDIRVLETVLLVVQHGKVVVDNRPALAAVHSKR